MLTTEDVAREITAAGPGGTTPEALIAVFVNVSRSTLNRRLRELLTAGRIRSQGRGPATRYLATAPYPEEAVRRYLATDWQSRPVVGFREELLLVDPALATEKSRRLRQLNAIARPLDKKFLADFLIDFAWASSLLEGSTYSAIDTQVLIEYGQRNADKPMADALLIMNHKNAIEYLWSHRELSVENLCRLQALLTDRYDLAEAEESEHFLPDSQRGVPREYQEVWLGRSAYSPPFRPGTGYLAQALAEVVSTSRKLEPAAAALYLITRLPYLQAFANGNKRTARLAANLPLLGAGMLPISFVDFDKVEYVLGMAAFYELGDLQIIERAFIRGYVRSIVRGSDLPPAVRLTGFPVSETVDELVAYVHSGRLPRSRSALTFMKATR